MVLSLYDRNGKKRADIAADDSSTQVKEIQGDNTLTLSFTHYAPIALDVNDYTDFMGERYWLTERYKPAQKSDGEWKYDVKLYGIESLLKRFLVLETTDGDAEPVFTLTAPAREHVALIVKCVNSGMGSTDWKVGEVADTDLIVIDYEGTYCDEALKEIAEKAGGKAEWWVEGQTVNVCRCEHGEEIALGYGKGLTSIERDTSDTHKFYTRLFPIGSSRNIDPARYGHSRLTLPGGRKHVEAGTEEYGIHDHYEEAAFSGIYPRRTGTVSSVRSAESDDGEGHSMTIYYFRDDTLDFDPNGYELAGETKRVSFQSGDLSGLGTGEEHYFEVNYDSETREFEIITIWPSDDMQLPGGSLVPKVGDRYILWNIRMPDEYYPMAEEEFLAAVERYNAEHWQDIGVYKAPTDHVWIAEHQADLHVGRRVRLESDKYFPETGYRRSRITKITRRVNLPRQMDLEISDSLHSGALDKVNDSLTDLKEYTRSATAGTRLPDIIKTGEGTRPTDTNLLSALRTLREIAQRSLSRLKADEARGLIKFLAGLETGVYKEGLSGARIDEWGNAELGSLVTRLKAILAGLQVNGASEFRGRLSSEEFASGFVGGKGWAIFGREVLNALGVAEKKYTGEFDEIVVRGALRVFTMVVSQLLGENDNRIFTGMMEVDHYDPATGRVYLNTRDGKLYNPFRADDYIMAQQYNGTPSAENEHYLTKHYELIVTAAGCGSPEEGEDRLDWVEFSHFVSADGRAAADVIAKGDTLTRVDNATDADRKGIIQIITVGSATPYMDIVYGMKTDPDGCLKGRLGNLQGIRHPLFGWLEGFGELLTNLYAVGDFRLRRTGESVDAKIEALRGVFATQYQRVTYEMTEDENYLKNATFTESLAYWEYENEARIITANGEALLMNGGTLNATGKTAAVEEYEGRNTLHLKESHIRQENQHIRKPGTHKEFVPPGPTNLSGEYTEVKDRLYLSLKFLAKSPGTLTAGFPGAGSEEGSLPLLQVAVESSTDWQTLQASGTWDGEGDFTLEYTGEMYVSLLSLTDKALDDFKKEVSTRIEQTDSNLRLLGTNADHLKGTVTQLGIDLDAANERLSVYAEKTDTLNGTVTQLGVRLDAAESKLSLYATQTDDLSETVTQLGIDLDAAEASLSLYAKKTDETARSVTELGVRLDAAEGDITLYAEKVADNAAAIAALQVKADSISSTVTSVEGDLETAKRTAAAAAQAAKDAADAAQERADSAWWAAYYAQEDAESAQGTADGAQAAADAAQGRADEAYGKAAANATAIVQNESRLSALAGLFDEEGHLLEGSGWVTQSSYNSLYSKVYDLDGKLAAKAELSTSVQYDPETGVVTSGIKLTADQIDLNGATTINGSFHVDPDGTTHIGGFTVSGSGLTNYPFENDAYLIFRNDEHKCFAGIGGNVLPSTSGLRGVARFENHDENDWWSLGRNYAMLVSARGASENIAIAMDGGCVSCLAVKTQIIGLDQITQSTAPSTAKRVTIEREAVDVYVTTQYYWRAQAKDAEGNDVAYQARTRDTYLTLPTMHPYDDGHEVRIKRGPNSGNHLYLVPGASNHREYSNGAWRTTSGTSYILYDRASYATPTEILDVGGEGAAMALRYHRDLSVEIEGKRYRGCWVQYKCPRDW